MILMKLACSALCIWYLPGCSQHSTPYWQLTWVGPIFVRGLSNPIVGKRKIFQAKVWKFSLWRHGDEEGVKREFAVNRLGEMLQGLIAAAEKKRMNSRPSSVLAAPA